MEKLKVTEIAKLYGVTRMTVYNWMDDGLYYEMEYKPGKKPYAVIDPQDVEDHIEDKKMQTRK